MARSKRQRDPIPDQFSSIEEAGEFWDSHDLGDYWDLTREAEFETDIQRRVFLTALAPELAKRLAECAHRQGVSTETLINVWLTEKLAESHGGMGPS
ncbi:MAG TPA: CopG family antitoxin [Blastocatellia bacterium]